MDRLRQSSAFNPLQSVRGKDSQTEEVSLEAFKQTKINTR